MVNKANNVGMQKMALGECKLVRLKQMIAYKKTEEAIRNSRTGLVGLNFFPQRFEMRERGMLQSKLSSNRKLFLLYIYFPFKNENCALNEVVGVVKTCCQILWRGGNSQFLCRNNCIKFCSREKITPMYAIAVYRSICTIVF